MIEQITQAVAAPFLEQVGVQGFAYGLLGLKTVRKVVRFLRETFGGKDGSE